MPEPVFVELSDGEPSWSKSELVMSPLVGCTMSQWARVWYKHRREIEYRKFWPRILFLSLMSIINSVSAFFDSILFGLRLSKQTLPDNPVFIVGLPRSGTTRLHNLLALDNEVFHTPDTLQATFPNGFLSMQPIVRFPKFRDLISGPRPMDNVELYWEAPQEDEPAMMMMSAGTSPFLATCIFSAWPELFKQLCNPETKYEHEKQKRWKQLFKRYVLKLRVQARDEQRPLFKSPYHMARIPILHEMFPNAKFIYIHREPTKVFQSMVHFVDSLYRECATLQTLSAGHVQEYIFELGSQLHDAYKRDSATLPEGTLSVVKFEDLVADPTRELRRIYKELDLPDIERVEPKLAAYTGETKGYKLTKHKSLSSEGKEYVTRRWQKMYEERSEV